MSGKAIFRSGEVPREPFTEGAGAWYDAPHIGIPFNDYPAHLLKIGATWRLTAAISCLVFAVWVGHGGIETPVAISPTAAQLIFAVVGLFFLFATFSFTLGHIQPFVWKYALEITDTRVIHRFWSNALAYRFYKKETKGVWNLADFECALVEPQSPKKHAWVVAKYPGKKLFRGKEYDEGEFVACQWETLPLRDIATLFTYRIKKAKGENPPPPEFS